MKEDYPVFDSNGEIVSPIVEYKRKFVMFYIETFLGDNNLKVIHDLRIIRDRNVDSNYEHLVLQYWEDMLKFIEFIK